MLAVAKAIQTFKEHLASSQYEEQASIQYYMIDEPESFTMNEIEKASGRQYIGVLQGHPLGKLVLSNIFANTATKLGEMQLNEVPGRKIYTIEHYTREGVTPSPEIGGTRDGYMAKRIREISKANPDKKILGLLGIGHILNPHDEQMIAFHDGVLENVRFHLSDLTVQYTTAIEMYDLALAAR